MSRSARLYIKLLAIIFVIACFIISHAPAQEHQHGVNVPDWYDADCCTNQDCHPVSDSDIDLSTDLGNPVVIYKPFGIAFSKARWRRSQDERFHVCNRGSTGFCVYLPGGA